MKKTPAIGIVVLGVLLLVVLAVVREQMSRELILKKDGLPLANLKANIIAVPTDPVISTATDADGRVDLSAVPAEAEVVLFTLLDGDRCVHRGTVRLPSGGKLTIDWRGKRAIHTTEKAFVLRLFELARERIGDWIDSVTPAKAEVGQPPPAEVEQLHLSEPVTEAVGSGESSRPAS